MRPRDLAGLVGQEHILGPGTWLRSAIERDEVSSVIFYGPAGTGKSTVAQIIAARTKSHWEQFSAVTSGVADVRKVMAQAAQRLAASGRRTILFIDEIHRFNKAQQDAFLPFVEDGTIILIGATTENPFFEINSPLLSRSRVLTFEPLTPEQIGAIVDRALGDAERGLGAMRVELDSQARTHLLEAARGDARVALNALEAAASLVEPDAEGKRVVAVDAVEHALQQPLLGYDKDGDKHYDIISAFIKSMRGSDPDAALHWLARMIKAGEDPRFIARRLVIHAAEDVGNADPMALVVATSAAHAVEYVGLPEAQIPLAQATIYIATAPKSNASYLGIHRAMQDVEERVPPPVPQHLRDSSYPGAARLGHGKGYRYPHDFPARIVDQEYLPGGAKSGPYYEPSESGYEREIAQRIREWDELRRSQRRPRDKE
ncbi:MAG: replication-associated recombination protein A [Armatimonadota bacterium]|nr:MAG: replication-associated recombination protein A [Armatimonadota bacterium]